MSTSGVPLAADRPAAEGDAGEATAGSRRGSPWGRVARAVVSLGLIAAVVWFVIPQVADVSDVWAAIRAMSALEVAVLAVAAAWNLVTYWIVMVSATPGLRYRQAAVLTLSTTAMANTVPAGGAVSIGLTYAMLASWGFSRSRSTLAVLVSGIWNNFVKLGTPIVALALLAVAGDTGGGRIAAALAGLAGLVGAVMVFVLILRSEDFAARAGLAAGRWASSVRRLLHRPPATGWDHAVVRFRNRVVGIVRHRWLRLTVATLVGHLSLFAVLLVALRQIGVSEREVGWAEVLAVFAFARLLTAIPITPGGVGFVEVALVAGLVGAGGDDAQVLAAVLVYRALTYVLPIPLGLATYVFWRRNRSWLGSAPPLDEALAPLAVGRG